MSVLNVIIVCILCVVLMGWLFIYLNVNSDVFVMGISLIMLLCEWYVMCGDLLKLV